MDSCVVPHRSTNRAVLWLTAQIGRDAVLSESYGRRHQYPSKSAYIPNNRLVSKTRPGQLHSKKISPGPQAGRRRPPTNN